KFITAILYHRKAKSIVIFVGAGNSFFERIPIIVLSKLTKKKVILFPRSGGIIRYERSKFYQKIISYALRKSDYIVCQSSFWYNYYSKYSNTPDKFLIVENWYPIEQLELSKSLKSPTWR